MKLHGEEIPEAFQNNIDIIIEKIFENAPFNKKGRFVRFKLDNISYEPSETVLHNWIKTNYLGINPSDPFSQSLRWDEIGRKGKTAYFTARRFGHIKASGNFNVYIPDRNFSPLRGTLELKNLADTSPFYNGIGIPELVKIVSPYSLMPLSHEIKKIVNISENLACSFYTEDSEKSKWSIHCEKFKE